MKLFEVITNFKLKGPRKYINSSTLCEFIVISWCNFSSENLLNVNFSINMHHEAKTNGKLIFYKKKHKVKEIGAACEAEIIVNNKVVSYCYFVEGNFIPAMEPSPIYKVSQFESFSDFSGICFLGTDSPLELLENVIEANKRLHLMSLDVGTYNVINMYMTTFPFGILKFGGMQKLIINNKRKRFQLEGIATISDFFFETLPEHKFQISFFAKKVI